MKILIVDDSVKVRDMLKNLFRDEIIYECGNAADALELYAMRHPDWVLMDVKLPLVDGVSATRSIMQQFPDAKIMIVTQYDDPITREQALAAGAKDYVLKENIFTLPDMLRAIN